MKVVCLEDCAQDAELLELHLRETWPDLEIEFVETEAEFRSALAQRPDVVISDSNVPGFDGLSALAVRRAIAPKIPFVFFCGDRRVELQQVAIEGGAVAFVAKELPERLTEILQRVTTDPK